MPHPLKVPSHKSTRNLSSGPTGSRTPLPSALPTGQQRYYPGVLRCLLTSPGSKSRQDPVTQQGQTWARGAQSQSGQIGCPGTCSKGHRQASSSGHTHRVPPGARARARGRQSSLVDPGPLLPGQPGEQGPEPQTGRLGILLHPPGRAKAPWQEQAVPGAASEVARPKADVPSEGGGWA